MKTIYVWGIKFNPLRKTEIVAQVQQWLEEGRKGIHLTGVNVALSGRLEQYPTIKTAINDSDIVNIDGLGVVLALRFYGYKVPERAACPDIFELLLQTANKKRQRVYFLGAEETVITKMVENIGRQYPGIDICGYHNGFYEDEARIVREIKEIAPTYLFLGMFSPKKEEFILKYKYLLNVGVCYGVGGVFDIKGGKMYRAPLFMQRLGLEWFCRIVQNPALYGRRALKNYPKFGRIFLKGLFEKKQRI